MAAECVVCLDAPPSVHFTVCGHRVVCAACYAQLVHATCPICRKPAPRDTVRGAEVPRTQEFVPVTRAGQDTVTVLRFFRIIQ